ncbi:MAG: ATP-binding cassette domain-containing protein [Clostridium sp.]|nr:MAG: ATP-binding cassette domain-containing protein [Clostridium sp.]
MQVTDLKIEIDGRVILNNISFTLNDNDKVGLVGINGAGKSTLLKALSNKDSNSVKLNDETISYLEQEIPIKYYSYSVIDYIKEVTHIKIS